MGHWELTQVSKEDPDTIVICRYHSVAEVYQSTLVLSVNQNRTAVSQVVWIGDDGHPLEIQITNGVGQTAIVFMHQHRFSTNDRLVIHGHIEGARHQYEWKSPPNAKSKSSIFGSKLKMRLHVTADGMIELRPEDPLMKFALVMAEGGELEFSKLQFRIPMFSNHKPPTYQSAVA